jgi:5-dehydro-4-deoxyglucarate dehydratase
MRGDDGVMTPVELRRRLSGLLAFPITPFTAANEIDVPRFQEHVEWQLSFGPAALFVCGGAGEFWSLSPAEYAILVKAGVQQTRSRMPVVATTGYGTPLAIEFAQAAEAAGADGLLVMPPYLLAPEQAGLEAHYRAIAQATRLGTIIYQRDNAVFTPATLERLAEVPTVIGLKDGLGQMERLVRQRVAVGERLAFMNGMPTAEASALAFAGLGITTYSSSVYNFVPALARDFHRALVGYDEPEVMRLLQQFYQPFGELRDLGRGYTVSLLKVGLGLVGRPAGTVRPPLVEPPPPHRARLREILQAVGVLRS